MARDDADIDRATSGVPDDYRPRSVAGMLTSLFDSSVDLLRKSTPLQGSAADELTRHNLGMGFIGQDASEAAPNFILSGAQAAARTVQITEVEKRKRDDERFALDQAKAALTARLAELDAELAAIDQRLEEIRQRRAKIGESLEALDEIEQIRRSGKKLDARNPAHRRLLESAGITEHDANRDDYFLITGQRRRVLGNEDSALESEGSGLLKRRDQVVRMRSDIADARHDIEGADTDEARLLAERRATTVLGAQQLGGAAFQTTDAGAKVTAANAVAANEEHDLRADSAALNRDVVAEGKAVLDPSAKAFVPG